MNSNLVRAAGQVLLSTLLATAVVFTALHQMVWQHQPTSYQAPRDAVFLMEGMMGSCSAVLIAPKTFLTAAHCAAVVEPKIEGKPVKILRISEGEDLMLVEADVDGTPIELGNTPFMDSDVIAVGWPMGSVELVTEGKMQGVLMDPRVPIEMYKDFVISAQLEGGFSGGGLFQFQDGKWKLIGILTAGSKTIGIAEPIYIIKDFLK